MDDDTFLNALNPTGTLSLSRLLFKMYVFAIVSKLPTLTDSTLDRFLPIFAPWLIHLGVSTPSTLFGHQCSASMSLLQSVAKDAMYAVRTHLAACFRRCGRQLGPSEHDCWKLLTEETFAVIARTRVVDNDPLSDEIVSRMPKNPHIHHI